jgi:hypothetical protein
MQCCWSRASSIQVVWEGHERISQFLLPDSDLLSTGKKNESNKGAVAVLKALYEGMISFQHTLIIEGSRARSGGIQPGKGNFLLLAG